MSDAFIFAYTEDAGSLTKKKDPTILEAFGDHNCGEFILFVKDLVFLYSYVQLCVFFFSPSFLMYGLFKLLYYAWTFITPTT